MQRIEITNFMAVKSASIEIKKTVLLIGEQAGGKSTIAKLIYFFKALRDDYIYFISENLEMVQSPDILQAKFWAEISRKFYRFFGSIQHLPSFRIQYWYSDTKSILLEEGQWDYGRKKLKISFSPSLFKQAILEIMPLIDRLKNVSGKRDIFESSVYRSSLEGLNKHIIKLFEDNRQPVFVPAGRNMAVTYADFFKQNFYGTLSSDLALIQDEDALKPRFVRDTYIMIQFLQRVQIMLDTFRGATFASMLESASRERSDLKKLQEEKILDKIEMILKGKYKHDENFGEIIMFTDQDYVFLNNASSGQQEIIRVLQDIFLNIVNRENVFRVIEEPEAHLFPMAQKNLLEVMAFMIAQTDSQIILTTHSPYILSVVNNLLFASTINKKSANSGSNFCLEPDETEVYSITNGRSASIIDRQTGLVDQNALDTISEELADEFEKMYNLSFQRMGAESQ